MSLLRRRALTDDACKLELPKEFQKVTYIESTGTQSIDTGYNVNQNTSFDCVFQLTAVQNDRMLLGARPRYISDGNPGNAYYQIYLNDNLFITQLGLPAEGYKVKQDLSKHYVKRTPTYLLFDGTYISQEYSNIESLGSNLWLFSRYKNVRNCKARIYKFDISENDVLVRSYIPCYRKSDNAIGMYDLINDVFHTNSGSGEFIYGIE